MKKNLSKTAISGEAIYRLIKLNTVLQSLAEHAPEAKDYTYDDALKEIDIIEELCARVLKGSLLAEVKARLNRNRRCIAVLEILAEAQSNCQRKNDAGTTR